jgi:hypothetical protein
MLELTVLLDACCFCIDLAGECYQDLMLSVVLLVNLKV